jgi:hypothetical protein
LDVLLDVFEMGSYRVLADAGWRVGSEQDVAGLRGDAGP